LNPILRRLRFVFALFAATVVGGTAGYMVLARLPFVDALYQTMIVVTTVGFQDLAFEPAVKPFTIALVAVGAVNMAIVLSVLTGSIVSAEVLSVFGRYKVERDIRKLHDHVILCGYGRFGRTIAAELKRKGTALVVIEKEPAKAASAGEDGHLLIGGDATDENTLLHAGIDRAKGLLTTLGSDADNVYVTLTAKQMKRSLLVVVSARDERSARKLQAAGADRVVSAYRLGGTRMAQAVTSPAVADFMELATGANPMNFYMEQQRIERASPLCGKTLKDSPIRRDLGVIVVALRGADGRFVTNPSPDTLLGEGDVLVSLGSDENLARLDRMARGDA
jgi:voltage-gated potassium channel